MGAPSKDRQAAFKNRMRAAGKKQLTIWVDLHQEEAVRALLAGTPARYQEQADEDTQDVREARLAAREQNLAEQERELRNRERELEQASAPDHAAQRATAMGHTARVNTLTAAFASERCALTGEPNKSPSPFMAKVQADLIAELARKTTTVRNGLAALLTEFGRRGILSDRETAALTEARHVADEISQAATTARQIVAQRAKRLEAEEAQRKRDAFGAVVRHFGTVGAADAILIAAQWAAHDLGYLFQGLQALAPGDPSVRHRTARLSESGRDILVSQIAYMMERTAQTADTVLSQLIGELEANRTALMERHGSLVRRLNTCLAADALTRTA